MGAIRKYLGQEIPTPTPPHERTDACENIIFPQRRWHALTISPIGREDLDYLIKAELHLICEDREQKCLLALMNWMPSGNVNLDGRGGLTENSIRRCTDASKQYSWRISGLLVPASGSLCTYLQSTSIGFNNYRMQTKYFEGNVFTGVCLFTGWGVKCNN